ncbi:hypothetical protein Hdeb2414_s0005g00185161 [Helianthus debilis subsp. tardiflorus]
MILAVHCSYYIKSNRLWLSSYFTAHYLQTSSRRLSDGFFFFFFFFFFFCHPHSLVIPGRWFLLLPIKLPLCSITIPNPEKPSIPSATDRALCVCLSLAPPP